MSDTESDTESDYMPQDDETFEYQYQKLFLVHTHPSHFDVYYQDFDKIDINYPYYFYWRFVTMAPYYRGSAASEKVLLYSLLTLSGQNPVKESAQYHRQADWIALLSPTFESFLSYIEKNKVFIQA